MVDAATEQPALAAWSNSSPFRHESLAAFEPLAPLYDRYTQADDYRRWGALLAKILRDSHAPGDTLLDVACGTGKSSVALAREGYRVTGCDLSPAMLERAANNPQAAGIVFVRADMRELPASLGTYDVVNCMDDAINFLLTDADLQAAFSCVAQVLKGGGLYIFDCNTLHTYRTWYSCSDIIDDGDAFFAWRGRCTPDHSAGQRAEADLYIYSRQTDGNWARAVCPHIQRHHPGGRLTATLNSAGLTLLGAYGLHSSGTLSRDPNELAHGKIIYVARK